MLSFRLERRVTLVPVVFTNVWNVPTYSPVPPSLSPHKGRGTKGEGLIDNLNFVDSGDGVCYSTFGAGDTGGMTVSR